MTEIKTYWLDRNRFLVIAILLLIIWGGFMVFLYIKADEITRDPCSICSEKQGEQVICTLGSFIPETRTYYPNGSMSVKDYN